MAYRLVKGEVRLYYFDRNNRRRSSQPDGDSAWFKPDDRNQLSGIGGRSAKYNAGGFTQLRFEAIDALELHYAGKNHQRKDPTVAARNFLLGALGFDVEQIVYRPDPDIPYAVTEATPEGVRAHILTRAIDPYHRPVSFVFVGDPPEADGAEVFLDVDRLEESVNTALMKGGHVYPAFYSARDMHGKRVGGFPHDLRQYFIELVDVVRLENEGVWAADTSQQETDIRNTDQLETMAIFPKLYRRLVAYFGDEEADHSSLEGFKAWLADERSDRDDLLISLSMGELLNFSDVLKTDGHKIRMEHPPEDLVIIPR
jgi:hypothetical protein